MKPPTEDGFKDTVIQLFKLTGWMVMHTRPATNRRGQWSTPLQGDPGFPDLVLAHKTRGVIFAELKLVGNKPTPAQLEWLRTLSLARQIAVVWTPDDWNEIEMFAHGAK